MKNAKYTIVCFGDSNTHGYNASTTGRFSYEERWPNVLQNELGPLFDVKEEGLSGRTTVFEDPLYEGLSGYNAIFPVLMTHEPVNLLIIMLGTNDVKSRFNATPENIGKGLDRLIQKAKATTDAFSGPPKILIICPPNIDVGYETSSIGGEMGPDCVSKSKALSPIFAQVAADRGCAFLDANTIPNVAMGPDDHMHLTKESHMLLAKAIAELIKDIK